MPHPPATSPSGRPAPRTDLTVREVSSPRALSVEQVGGVRPPRPSCGRRRDAADPSAHVDSLAVVENQRRSAAREGLVKRTVLRRGANLIAPCSGRQFEGHTARRASSAGPVAVGVEVVWDCPRRSVCRPLPDSSSSARARGRGSCSLSSPPSSGSGRQVSRLCRRPRVAAVSTPRSSLASAPRSAHHRLLDRLQARGAG